MSDPKRATLITVVAPKSVKNNVSRTVRLNINLEESNESKYPELNYKELVIAEERKKQVQNGKTTGLDPFSDNDEDVQRVARKFEQKYGGKSTYGRKGRSKHDDYADIGAGYDENDSFIDNTDGYDEIIPPECDTYLGGFYINSGSLEFKSVPVNRTSDSDGPNNRRNKRRISSSSSSEESSESSSESESGDEKSAKEGLPEKVELVNGAVDQMEHRKKKSKKSDKKKAKRVRRTDSSAATSGKQTSDDNAHMEVESGDSRTSQSDSLASKPAPSSENAVTSDSSRDASNKASEVAMPAGVAQALDSLAVAAGRSNTALADSHGDTYILMLDRALASCGAEAAVCRAAWARAARSLDTPRGKLVQRARALNATASAAGATVSTVPTVDHATPAAANVQSSSNPVPKSTTNATGSGGQERNRKRDEDLETVDVSKLSPEEREAKINETIDRLKWLIEERRPSMIQNYKAECERVQEERKKLMIASASDGVPRLEKRLPKRRFPWCQRTRSLLTRLTRLSQDEAGAAVLLVRRVLPLFPEGFVRLPTLLRQAGLSREFANVKPSEMKKHLMISAPPAVLPPPPQSQPLLPPQHAFTEPIHFPSSLTVTTSVKSSADADDKQKYNQNNATQPAKNSSASKQESQFISTNTFNSVIVSNKDNTDKQSDKEDKTKSSKDVTSKVSEKSSSMKTVEKYVPPNSIGSITITPVLNNHIKSDSRHATSINNSLIITSDKQKEPLIRVKSAATLLKEANEIAKKEKDKNKSSKHDKQSHTKMEEKVHTDTPLYVDTSQPKEHKKPDTPSPSLSKEEISQRQIENMRVSENNIPRPALVPVHHSPTFAKPARPPDAKKSKKDIVIVSDVDPLADVPQEPYGVDDSSSDVELVEDVAARTKPSESSNPKTNVKINDSRTTTVVKHVNDTKSVPLQKHHHHSGVKNDIANHKHHSKHSSKDKSKSGDSKGHRNNSEASRRPSTDKMDVDDAEMHIDNVMRNLREMQDSQEPNFTSNSYGGVISSAKRVHSSNSVDVDIVNGPGSMNKLTNFFEQHGWL